MAFDGPYLHPHRIVLVEPKSEHQDYNTGVRGCGQGWARGVDEFRLIKISSRSSLRKKVVTEVVTKCVALSYAS